MKRKPAGYWKRGNGKEIVTKFVAGEITEDDAVKGIQQDCRALGVDAEYLTDEIIREDVRWYAREVRNSLGESTLRRSGQGVIRNVERTVIGEGGRIVIPAAYRQALAVKEGDTVVMHLQDAEVRILRPDQALRRSQILVRRYVSDSRSLADELIAERRQESQRE